MRIWVMSDLHLEFSDMRLPLKIPQADICVVAGDVTTGGILPSLRWLHDNISFRMPVVFVAGNHEFYGASLPDSLENARRAAPMLDNIHCLDGGSVEIDGTVFIGATLWTDFRLPGDREAAMVAAGERMNDYRNIRFGDGDLRPAHTAQIHARDRATIEQALRESRTGPLVVVTHHAPSEKSLPEDLGGKLLSAAYASDLEAMIISAKPDLWIHGHVHERRDYRLGTTRILAHPRGYPGEPNHALFDAGLVVEV